MYTRLFINMVSLQLIFIPGEVESCRRTAPRPECTVMPTSVIPSFARRNWSPPTQGTAKTATSTWSMSRGQHNDYVQLDNCGLMAVDPESAIIKGHKASEKSWPWMGLVRGEHGLCGATLISESWVLTAAHCVPGVFSVTFGQSDKNRWTETSQSRFPSQQIVHRLYDRRRKDYDLAMVLLDRPVIITDNVRPVCLPFNNISYSACYASGWGRDSLDDPHAAKFLKQLKVTIMPNNHCAYKWMMDGLIITDRQVCTDVNIEGAGLCSGDSGSSLSCKSGDRYYASGVASFVERGCKRKHFPDVYTRIMPYMDWIRNVMKWQK